MPTSSQATWTLNDVIGVSLVAFARCSYSLHVMESWKPDCASALQRKRLQSLPAGLSSTFLQCGFSARAAELRQLHVIFMSMPSRFSAPLTLWRRERDSNPRYPFRYSGFQ